MRGVWKQAACLNLVNKQNQSKFIHQVEKYIGVLGAPVLKLFKQVKMIVSLQNTVY